MPLTDCGDRYIYGPSTSPQTLQVCSPSDCQLRAVRGQHVSNVQKSILRACLGATFSLIPMAGQLDLTKTPTKISKLLNISPKSKGCLCIICGSVIDVASNRRKLFIGNTKTESCLLIEAVLKVSVHRKCSTHTVCRQCVRDVTRVDNTLSRLVKSFEKTSVYLYQSHGTEVTKRLRPDDDSESRDSWRKSLFQEKSSEVSSDTNTASTVKCSRDYGDIDAFKVTITAPDGFKRTVCHPLSHLALATASPDFKNLSTLILEAEVLKPYVISGICHEIQKEIAKICSKKEASVLRTTTASSLQNLSWESIANGWQTKAPTYWTFLQVFASNPSLQRNKTKTENSLLPAIVSAGSKLLSIYNRELNGLQHLNSIILLKGGTKKSAFNRLCVTRDSTSYSTAIHDTEQLSREWDVAINEWKARCEADYLYERDHLQNVSEVQKYVAENGASPNSLLLLDQEQKALDVHRVQMHPGYDFVGDNVDFYTKVRFMSSKHQNQSQHMFQICAYKNRVSGNTLDDLRPQKAAKEIKFSTLLPSQEEQSILVSELAFIVAKKWREFIPSFRIFEPVLPPCIPHKYMKEMRQKTERINLGVLEKNEQYNDDMTDICEFIHKFVPGHDEGKTSKRKPLKVLSGGDYLTFERHKQTQTCKSNGRTPSKLLQGLIPKIEEFHNQAEFLKLIWSLLYDTSSSNSIGTLYAARNKMNSRNVPSDPHDNYYASSVFMDKVTTAYIIAGGLHHFQMETLHSTPQPEYAGPVGDKETMKEYIMEHARQFVMNHGSPDVPNLPDYGIQSNDLKCRYCDKGYIRPTALRKHEAKIHGHPDPKHNPQPEVSHSDKTSSKSSVYDYTKLCLTLGLLRLNHNDAIKFGDGERMLRIAKFFCLFYKAGKCPKYAFALLETTSQANGLLSARQAERLVWNRTVNHQGKIDTNHPNDLDLEHCNKVFKEDVHTYRGKYTEKTILRVSRSALASDGICKKFDNVSKVRQSSGKHTKGDASEDILLLAEQLHTTGNVYDMDYSRVHDHFPNIKDPLEFLNMEDIQTWISDSLKKFGGKLFYK